MEENAKLTFEEYLNLLLSGKGFDFEILDRLDSELLSSFKQRLDDSLDRLSNFDIHSNFSKDDEALLLEWIQPK